MDNRMKVVKVKFGIIEHKEKTVAWDESKRTGACEQNGEKSGGLVGHLFVEIRVGIRLTVRWKSGRFFSPITLREKF